MRIISYNLNGIRAAIKKGFIEWLQTDPAEIICIQETKATQDNIDVQPLLDMGFHIYWFAAQKKGYSGVAVFTKIKPKNIVYGNGYEMSDFEGRVIRLDFENFSLFNAYFPAGVSGVDRQTYKYQWLDEMLQHINEFKKTQKKFILCGDYNIAHTEIDIHDPKGNKNNSGFLPEERQWMTQFLAQGYVDTFRYLHPDALAHYTWWSQRFPSVRLQNKGWRIDYICVTEPLREQIIAAAILPEVKHSDHCPTYLELNI